MLWFLSKQQKSKPSPFQYNYVCSIYLITQNLKPAFLRKKIWRNGLALKSKILQGPLGETFILTYILTFIEIFIYALAVFCLSHNISNFFQFDLLGRKNTFIRFHEEMKLISWTWCTFLKKSWLKIKITKKTEKRFYGWKSNDYNNINIFLSLENPCTLLLAKLLKAHM